MKFFPYLLIPSTCILFFVPVAQTQAVTTQFQGYRLPRATVMMMAGDYISGWSDGLVSLYNTPTSMVYTDGQFEGSGSDSGIASLGLGYRQGDSHNNIWGGYFFIDRARSGSENYYTVLGPGVEFLGAHWGARLNGYAAIDKKTHLIRSGYADDFGNFSYVKFTGHTELDRLAYDYEEMDYGGDLTVSYRYGRWQGLLRPYAFHLNSAADIIGGKAELRYQVNSKLTTFVADGYDNANHNRIIAGIGFSFGHGSNQNGSFESRMMSPVYRNLDVNTTANGLPVRDYTDYSGSNVAENNNIYFFDNGGGLTSNLRAGQQASVANGTYEHPYTSLSQIADAPSDAKLWFAGSTGKNYSSNNTISLTGTQQLEGRTNNFKEAATSADDQPTLKTNGLSITSDNSLKDFTLLGQGNTSSVGVTVTSSTDSSAVAGIDNVTIGSTTAADSFEKGISITGGGKADIEDSTIRALSSTGNNGSLGIEVAGSGSSATLTNSTVTSNTTTTSGQAIGVGAQTGSQLTVNNSTVNATGEGLSAGVLSTSGATVSVNDSTIISTSQQAQAFGLLAQLNSILNMNGGSVSATSNATTASGVNFADAVRYEGGTASGTIENVTLTAHAFNNSSKVTGVLVGSNGTVNLINNTINVVATGNDSQAVGILGGSFGSSPTVTATNNSITASAIGNNSFGYGLRADGGVIYNSGNTFNITATNATNTAAFPPGQIINN